MRDNYVGDIGDYVKYGLLRHLAAHTGLRLGVVWYLYPDPCKVTDGADLDYLDSAKEHLYRDCDYELYDKLRNLIAANDRNVAAVKNRELLPKNTIFYEAPLSFSGLPKGAGQAKLQREQMRQQWLAQALAHTEASDLVFLDPDNGLEISSTPYHRDKGPKFAFYREVEQFWQRGQSLVIYQHKNFHETTEIQIRNRFKELGDRLNTKEIYAIYLPNYSGRIFFVVPQPKVDDSFKKASEAFARQWPQVSLFNSDHSTSEIP
jgi:hypothetical protein